MHARFSRLSTSVTDLAASPAASALALALVLAWIGGGLARFGFGPEYQGHVTTVATLVSFVLSFLILNAQVRGDKATHLKLDELIRAQGPADNRMIGAEERSEADLDEGLEEYRKLHGRDGG